MGGREVCGKFKLEVSHLDFKNLKETFFGPGSHSDISISNSDIKFYYSYAKSYVRSEDHVSDRSDRKVKPQ